MKYIYFISYFCQVDNPIMSVDQLSKIVLKIQDENNLMKVTPLYYTLLREERKQ